MTRHWPRHADRTVTCFGVGWAAVPCRAVCRRIQAGRRPAGWPRATGIDSDVFPSESDPSFHPHGVIPLVIHPCTCTVCAARGGGPSRHRLDCSVSPSHPGLGQSRAGCPANVPLRHRELDVKGMVGVARNLPVSSHLPVSLRGNCALVKNLVLSSVFMVRISGKLLKHAASESATVSGE